MRAKPTSPARVLGGYQPIAWRDFQLIGLGYLALLGLVAAGDRLPLFGIPRLALVLVYIFFVPGYCLTSALLSRASDLSRTERAALSTGLSIALIPILALILDALPWGIAQGPILIVLGLASAIFAGAALAQRALRPAEPPAAPMQRLGRRELGSIGLLLVAALLSSLILGLVRSAPPADSQITEFYALGDEGLAEGYPRKALVGQPLSLSLGITNREGAPMRYRIVLRDGAQQLRELGPIELASGASWQEATDVAMTAVGASRQLEMLLFIEGRAEPYRRLALWVDVYDEPAAIK
jgi:uncharacterized membrane protein